MKYSDTNGPINQPTETVTYRVACTQLKHYVGNRHKTNKDKTNLNTNQANSHKSHAVVRENFKND